MQASWEEAAEDSTAAAVTPAVKAVGKEQWPLPGASISFDEQAERQQKALTESKADTAEAWAAATAGDDAQAAQGDAEEFDPNVLWCVFVHTIAMLLQGICTRQISQYTAVVLQHHSCKSCTCCL